MRRFMLTVLALASISAMAEAAAPSASAAEIFLTNATYPQNIVTTDNKPVIVSSGLIMLQCTSLLAKGTLWTPKKLLLLVLIHGCKDSLGNGCNSAGEPIGLIHNRLLVLPVWLNKAQTLPGLLFERHQGNADYNHFTCGFSLGLVKGKLLGHISKPAPKVKSHTMEMEILVKGGGQEFEKVEEGIELFKLEMNLNGGSFSPVTLEITKDLVEFEKAGVEAEFR